MSWTLATLAKPLWCYCISELITLERTLDLITIIHVCVRRETISKKRTLEDWLKWKNMSATEGKLLRFEKGVSSSAYTRALFPSQAKLHSRLPFKPATAIAGEPKQTYPGGSALPNELEQGLLGVEYKRQLCLRNLRLDTSKKHLGKLWTSHTTPGTSGTWASFSICLSLRETIEELHTADKTAGC